MSDKTIDQGRRKVLKKTYSTPVIMALGGLTQPANAKQDASHIGTFPCKMKPENSRNPWCS